ncbi:MAG: hypothetical protein JSR60_07095 [Proteobacteria bacterium]|nr:hypothetical protein [Pseudomonadota bacterium]
MMLKTFGLAVVLMAASGLPAAAASMCSAPIAPAAIDGSTATKAQLEAGLVDVKTFLKQSDDYQDCLNQEWVAARDAAVKAKTDLDPAVTADRDAKIHANQALKEKVGAEFNAAAAAYNHAHPGN